jgi:hypothetical protein
VGLDLGAGYVCRVSRWSWLRGNGLSTHFASLDSWHFGSLDGWEFGLAFAAFARSVRLYVALDWTHPPPREGHLPQQLPQIASRRDKTIGPTFRASRSRRRQTSNRINCVPRCGGFGGRPVDKARGWRTDYCWWYGQSHLPTPFTLRILSALTQTTRPNRPRKSGRTPGAPSGWLSEG